MSKSASNSKGDRAYRTLRRSLADREFEPGERLTQRRLSNLTEAIRQTLCADETLVETI